MPLYQDQSRESGTLNPDVSPCQQQTSLESDKTEAFKVGDWDQFDEWFGSDDDDDLDTFTDGIYAASPASSCTSLGVHDVDSSDAAEWIELEHEDADPTSYQLGSLAPHLEATSLSNTSTSDSESESSSQSELSETQREYEISCAQQMLVSRALRPQRRDSLLPYRKTIPFKPVPLMLRPKGSQGQAGANQCPQCSSTIFRMISSKCCLACATNNIRSTIEDLEFQGEINEAEYREEILRISDRKCEIEEEHPDDYSENAEWVRLRNEYAEFSEERDERNADLKARLAELEALLEQYAGWEEEDMAKYR